MFSFDENDKSISLTFRLVSLIRSSFKKIKKKNKTNILTFCQLILLCNSAQPVDLIILSHEASVL